MKKVLSTILCAAMLAPAIPQTVIAQEMYPYQDTSLSFEERAADLVSRMTLEEKVAQTGRNAPEISRLGVHKYNYWREGIHGVARQGQATSFPSSLAMSNTWDTELMREAMDITSTEARGKNNRYDLSYWNPTINMARDPRWGRNEESYGEDPYLTSQIGAAAVEGMQGNDEKYLKIISTLKHYAANNCEGERQTGSSVMNEKTLREYYTKAFGDIIESSSPASVMSSYNAITMKRNGETVIDYIASSANKYILTDVLRRTYGFDGYVVGDCGAFENLYGRQSIRQKLFPDWNIDDITGPMALSRAFIAGAELDCGSRAQTSGYEAVTEGWMSEDTLDVAVYRLMLQRMRTGEFDDGAKYQDITSDVIEKDSHVKKALEAGEKSWVLLENRDNTLPLKSDVTNIAVVGNLATEVTLGDYSGEPTKTSTPYDGIAAAVKELNPAATVEMIGNVKDSTPLFNINKITLVKNDNTEVAVNISKAQSVRNMELEGSELRNITKSGMAVVPGVNFADVKEVKISAASLPGMPKVSVNIGYSNSTQTVAVVDIASTEADKYNVNTGEYTGASGGYNQTADMYITISASSEFSVENYKDSLDRADYIIAYAGTTVADSSESNDRESIDLPITQTHAAEICGAYPDKAIVVLSTVGQVNVEEFKDSCKAMLWNSYNGQAQGEALGNILTGKAVPSGKLTTTWYTESDLDLLPLGSPKETVNGITYNNTDYEINQHGSQPGRTYQYYKGNAVYPFGYGKSYTEFDYSNLTVDKAEADVNDTLNIKVDITNMGEYDGAEVAQLYVSVPGADGVNLPYKQLKGFDRVEIAAGQTQTAEFTLNLSDVTFFDETAQSEYAVNGEYTLAVGKNSSEIEEIATVMVTGELSKDIKRAYTVPTGIKLVAAVNEEGAAPVNEIDADANVVLRNNAIITDLSAYEVAYTSSDENVATVDENGIVKAGNTAGVATITLTVTEGENTVTSSFPVVTELKDRVADEIVEGYVKKLDDAFSIYSEAAFTAENWEKVTKLYNDYRAKLGATLLGEDLAPLYDEAVEAIKSVEKVTLEASYTIDSQNKWVISKNAINYSSQGIGEYVAEADSISGTITKENPAKIALEVFDADSKLDSSKLVWTIEKLDNSLRKAAEIDSYTGELTLYENGIFKVVANDYTNMKCGEIIINANLQIEAESAEDMAGAVPTANSAASGAATVTSGGWLRFDGVKLDRLTGITFRASQGGEILVSLGSNADRVIASAKPDATGDSFATAKAVVNRKELEKLNLDENGCGTIYVKTNTACLDFIELEYLMSDFEISSEKGGKIKLTIPYESGVIAESKYDNGRLVSVKTTEFGAAGEYILEGYAEGDEVKITLWDGILTMNPLDDAVNHTYAEPVVKSLTIYRFDDAAFDSFFDTSDGLKLTSGTGMDGIGGWQTQAKSRTATYNGVSYTFTRGLKGGRGSSTLKCVYFTPEADGVVTVFFEANTERYVIANQNGKDLAQCYGIGDGVLTAMEVPVEAGSPVYIYGGGSNKTIFAVFFDTEKEYVKPTATPEPTATPTPEPLPDTSYTAKTEFEDYNNCWANTGMTKSAVSGASNSYVIDNTRNNDTFYFGERDMNDLAVIELVAGTKETGIVTVEFFAVDVSGLDLASMSQSQIDALLTSDASLGSTTLIASTKNWNDFKSNNIVVKNAKAGTMGLFMKSTTTGKYCGNFDYFNLMYK